MKKYEFKFVVSSDSFEEENKLFKTLDKLQDEGWEVINHSSVYDSKFKGGTVWIRVMLRREFFR